VGTRCGSSSNPYPKVSMCSPGLRAAMEIEVRVAECLQTVSLAVAVLLRHLPPWLLKWLSLRLPGCLPHRQLCRLPHPSALSAAWAAARADSLAASQAAAQIHRAAQAILLQQPLVFLSMHSAILFALWQGASRKSVCTMMHNVSRTAAELAFTGRRRAE
jgi:hypothetical protein